MTSSTEQAYLGLGLGPSNVIGMLFFYRPEDDPEGKGHGQGHHVFRTASLLAVLCVT